MLIRFHSRWAAMGLFIAWIAWIFVLGASPAVAASGGGDGGSTGYSSGDSTPGQKAISEYRKGEKKLERAKDYRLEIIDATETGDLKKAAKLEGKATSMYERAERYFRKAIKYDESLFQAWSARGYSLRRLGRYDEALEAYDRAIELEPRYAEAVEYRAEAYLHLGRLEDVQSEYLRLASWVKPMAAMLRVKMEEWQATHADDPGEVDPVAVAELGVWLEQLREHDGASASVSARQRVEW